LCISGITWEIFGNTDTRPKTFDACGTLKNDLFDKCIIKADLMGNDGKTFQSVKK